MTHPITEALLKKINYIEADVEIHKQILFSIPSAQKAEIERTITLIAAKKKEIEALRQELQKQDPAEHDRILLLEKAIADFKRIGRDRPFQVIIDRKAGEECSLAVQGGDRIECLIKACDKDGNWTIITINGEIVQFQAADVAEKPPENNAS